MIQDLYISEGGYKAYVEGHYLLQLLEARMDKATKASPRGRRRVAAAIRFQQCM